MDIEELVKDIEILKKRIDALEAFVNKAFQFQTSGFDKIATLTFNDEGRVELKDKE